MPGHSKTKERVINAALSKAHDRQYEATRGGIQTCDKCEHSDGIKIGPDNTVKARHCALYGVWHDDGYVCRPSARSAPTITPRVPDCGTCGRRSRCDGVSPCAMYHYQPGETVTMYEDKSMKYEEPKHKRSMR